MKKIVLIIISVIVFAALSITALGGFALESNAAPVNSPSETTGENMNAELNSSNALTLRLSQLLNLNRVYDDFFNYSNILVDEASVVLKDYALTDENQNNYINQGNVVSFIYDLYGIKLDVSALPKEYTENAPAGYFNIIARGYDSISNTLTGLDISENGNITVTSSVTMTGHDGVSGTGTAKTVFVANESSAFGYNIISSEITSFSYDGDNTAPSLILPDGTFDSICLY